MEMGLTKLGCRPLHYPISIAQYQIWGKRVSPKIINDLRAMKECAEEERRESLKKTNSKFHEELKEYDKLIAQLQ